MENGSKQQKVEVLSWRKEKKMHTSVGKKFGMLGRSTSCFGQNSTEKRQTKRNRGGVGGRTFRMTICHMIFYAYLSQNCYNIAPV